MSDLMVAKTYKDAQRLKEYEKNVLIKRGM